MGKTLYLECMSGISGDMMVGALLDLGADVQVLENALNSLPVNGFSIQITRVKKAGLDVCDFLVQLDAQHDNHDHDMHYLHGTSPDAVSEHHSAHSHEHLNLADIVDIIQQAALTQRARKLAVSIFELLAQAEAKAHGTTVEQVHFHEVGAVDSIVDIVAAAVCLDNLDITEVVIPVLYEGRGTVRCQHGILPVPVPAVANIAAAHGLNIHIMDAEGEFVTPTGAAIAAAVKTASKLPDQFVIEKIGQGAGKRVYEKPSILRAMLIQETTNGESTSKRAADGMIYKLESNVDDCTGEALGYLMQRLFAAGARDVYYSPVMMKKNRPAYQINVICDEQEISILQAIIFEETTTIGIRRVQMERTMLEREMKTVDTPLGSVRVKVCRLPNGVRAYPEYSDIERLCKSSGCAFQDVFRMVMKIMEK